MSGLGNRIVVTGMSGAGKSTFSKSLAEITKLPLVHVDLLSWDPGWTRRSTDVVRQHLQPYLRQPSWIIDGNDQLDVSLKHADTLIIINTPWWLCAWRAFLRGLYRAPNSVLPDGCEESNRQRLMDEWAIVIRHFRRHRIWYQEQQTLAQEHRDRITVYMPTHVSELRRILDAASNTNQTS